MSTAKTVEEWFEVALQRANDAEAMIKLEQSNGPVYMAGWVLECSLNGYLQRKGISRPTRRPGEASHDLVRLWKKAGFKMGDLADKTGQKSWLLSSWGTHLRYDAERHIPFTNEELIRAAKSLNSFIKNRLPNKKRG